MEAQIFTIGMSIISVVLSNLISLVAHMGKPSELKDKLEQLKLDRLEKTADAHKNFGNHIIKQVDSPPDDRVWRKSETGEVDHAYDFAKKNIESTLFVARTEKLRSRTNVLLFLSLLLPCAAALNVACAFMLETSYYTRWTSGVTALCSLAYLVCYYKHSIEISNMDRK